MRLILHRKVYADIDKILDYYEQASILGDQTPLNISEPPQFV